MITEGHAKENLSRAYVLAVAAKAGIVIKMGDRSHDYGIDGDFHQVSIIRGARKESGITLHFQLKSTTNFVKTGEYIRYELDAQTHAALADRAKQVRAVPAVLLVLCLPNDPLDQFSIGEEELIIRNCCYWHFVSADFVKNKRSVTIEIPRQNMLTPKNLNHLLQQIEHGEHLSGQALYAYR